MSIKILLLDDDDEFRETLSMFLTSEGFSVVEAKTGDEALDILQKGGIECSIIDVLLPRKNGFKVFEEMKALPNVGNSPVIMISGFYKGYKHRQDAVFSMGAMEYLEKPFDFLKDLKPHLIKLFQKRYPSGVLGTTSSVSNSDPFEDPIVDNTIDKKGFFSQEPTQTMNILLEDLDDDLILDKFPTSGILDITSGEVDLSFPKLLIELYNFKFTGELFVENLNGEIKKLIYLSKGLPVFVKSTLVSECLGHVLVSEKIITSKDLDKSLDLMKQTRKPQGKILREMNCISLENLKYGLLRQLEIKLHDIFSWNKIKYRYKEIKGELPIPPTIHEFEYSFAYLIYQGVMKGYDIEMLKPMFKKHATKKIYHTHTEKLSFKEGELFDDELEFFGNLQHGTSLFETIKEHADEKEYVLKQMLVYYFLGMIEFR
ncbi:response regulator [bacterium]|nr:response regulator [bacterium]